MTYVEPPEASAIRPGNAGMLSAKEKGGHTQAYAWYVVILLTLAYALAILDRVSIALLIEPLEADLHLSDTQFGLLQGMAFSIFYSVLGLPIGMLCDRTKRVPILSIGLALWSLATIGCSFATTFHELFVARMLVGVGEASLIPAAASLIADYFSPKTRPKAYGVFVMGSSLGTGAALILSGIFLHWSQGIIDALPMIAGDFKPWQIVFILCGLPGVLLALVMALTAREPKRRGVSEQTTRFGLKPILTIFGRHPAAFAALIVGTVLNIVCVYAMMGWLPALFIRVHGWEASTTGQVLGFVGVPISLFTAANSGWVISWLGRKGRRDGPMLAAAVCGVSMAILGTSMCLAPTGFLAILAYGANSLFVNWNISSVYSGVAQISPNHLRGQVMAIHTITSSLLALTAGNFIVGFLTDNYFTGPEGVSYALACVFAVCGTASAALLLSGRKAFSKAAADNDEDVAANA